MVNNIFSNAFLREMNYKAAVLKKLESLRKSDNVEYSNLVNKYSLQYRRLHSLPIERLKELAEELK